MKVANASSNKPSKKVKYIILLKCDKAHHKLTKENSVSWELRTIPTQVDSPTYEVLVRILSGDKSVQQMLRWRKDIDKVGTGVNATDLASKKPIMLACVRPRVASLFKASLTGHATTAFNEALRVGATRDSVHPKLWE